MANPLVKRAFRGLPVARALAAAELVVLVRQHLHKLEPHERRRVLELLRRTRGRPSALSKRERRELASLVAKVEPRAFVGTAVGKLTGLPVPSRKRS